MADRLIFVILILAATNGFSDCISLFSPNLERLKSIIYQSFADGHLKREEIQVLAESGEFGNKHLGQKISVWKILQQVASNRDEIALAAKQVEISLNQMEETRRIAKSSTRSVIAPSWDYVSFPHDELKPLVNPVKYPPTKNDHPWGSTAMQFSMDELKSGLQYPFQFEGKSYLLKSHPQTEGLPVYGIYSMEPTETFLGVVQTLDAKKKEDNVKGYMQMPKKPVFLVHNQAGLFMVSEFKNQPTNPSVATVHVITRILDFKHLTPKEGRISRFFEMFKGRLELKESFVDSFITYPDYIEKSSFGFFVGSTSIFKVCLKEDALYLYRAGNGNNPRKFPYPESSYRAKTKILAMSDNEIVYQFRTAGGVILCRQEFDLNNISVKTLECKKSSNENISNDLTSINLGKMGLSVSMSDFIDHDNQRFHSQVQLMKWELGAGGAMEVLPPISLTAFQLKAFREDTSLRVYPVEIFRVKYLVLENRVGYYLLGADDLQLKYVIPREISLTGKAIKLDHLHFVAFKGHQFVLYPTKENDLPSFRLAFLEDDPDVGRKSFGPLPFPNVQQYFKNASLVEYRDDLYLWDVFNDLFLPLYIQLEDMDGK